MQSTFFNPNRPTFGYRTSFPDRSPGWPPLPADMRSPGYPLVNPQAQFPVDTMTFAPPQPLVNAKSDEIKSALNIVGSIQHLPADELYLKQRGINITFKNGSEALNLIQDKNIRVEFGDMGNSDAHAQWIAEQNLIMINQKYRGDYSKATLYALSEAIYHEAGHAALLGDNQASLQEEIDCLALNTLAHRYHTFVDKDYARSTSTSRLIADGVALYPKLFFNKDPNPLVNRIIKKYGDLPPETADHRTPRLPYHTPIADQVMRRIQLNRSAGWVA